MSQSAQRAFGLLLAITDSDSDLGLMEICARTGIDKSTATRLLSQLEQMKLVLRQPETKKYSVGPRMIAASASALRRLDLRTVARPHLRALRDETNETVTLHLKIDGARICIDGIESSHGVRRVVPLGERSSLVDGLAGRAVLALLADDEVKKILSDSKLAAALRKRVFADVDRVRTEGFLAGPGSSTGVAVITVPLRLGSFGVGALAVSGPAERWTMELAREFGSRLVEAARKIEADVQH